MRNRIIAVLAAALLAPSCRAVQNTMAPAGPAAARIAVLGWLVLIAFSVATVVMWVLVFWVVRRRAGTLATHLPWDATEDRRWITIGGFTIPVIVLATIFIVMLRTMSAFPMGDHEMPGQRSDIRVVGHQWWWEVQYLDPQPNRQAVTANEIHIPIGRPVDIELGSRDVIHSFWVPRLHGKVDLVPGLLTRIRIQADEAGTYRGQCAEYCGAQHAHMALVVVAEPPAQFAAWLDRLRAPAAQPGGGAAGNGEHVFMSHQCVLCHTIRGTAAQGLVGPDLTHFGRRRGIAANTFANATGPLTAWVTHAQSLKPHTQMPNMATLSGDDVQALVAYLESLQ
jgi:cytochrome c oxidase subunit 2